MNFKSLSTAIEKKLAAPSELDLAAQEMDAEVGAMALTCVQNSKKALFKDSSNVWEKLVNKVKEIANKPLYENVAPLSAATALGGAGLGALAGSQLVSREEGESKQDFDKRKRDMALTAALAGGALGAGTPSILNGLGVLGSKPDSVPEAVWNMVPFKGYAAGGAAGAGAGYLAGKGLQGTRMVGQTVQNAATKGFLENLQLANPKNFEQLPQWKLLQSEVSNAADSALAGKGPRNLRSLGSLLGIPIGIGAYHFLAK